MSNTAMLRHVTSPYGEGAGGWVHLDEIAQAAAILRAGGLVAFPTETVYGLGADASNEDAVRRLFAAKGRPADHPVIVHLAHAAQLGDWAREIPDAARKLADAFWPGPLTLIVPRAAHVLDAVTGGQDSVGIRVPRHPVAHGLLTAFGGGVAAPSANRFGRISPTRAAHVRAEFDADTVPTILDGDPPDVGVESTIVDCTGPHPTLLRPGGITPAQIAAVLGTPLAAPTATAPRASGTLKSHYAPVTPLEIVPPDALRDALQRVYARGEAVAVLSRRPPEMDDMPPLSAPETVTMNWIILHAANAAAYGRALYKSLRTLDADGAARILVEDVPEGQEWLAVRDRLRRAAAKPD